MNTSINLNTGKESKKNESESAFKDALIASEARYRRLFETAKDGILILDAESGNIIDVNPFLIDLLGYSKEEFIGKEIWEIGLFKDITANTEKILELQQKGYVRYDNLPLETTNGRKINVEFVSNVYFVDKKKVIQCNIRDITEQKQTEEIIRDSEERLKILFEFAPDAYYLCDLKGNFIDGNIAAGKLLEYNKNELIGKSFLNLNRLSPVQLLKASKLLTENLLGKATGPDEFVLNRKDGSTVTVEISTHPVKIKNQNIVLGIARDITDRIRSEKEIIMLAHSLKSINECVSITDLNDNIQFVNDSFLKTYGYNKNELIGKPISIVRSINNIQELVKEILPSTVNGEWQGELLNSRKDGSEFMINLSTSVIKDKENNILGLIGVATDITDRKREEIKLIEAKENAVESDHLKSAFLANMSHEIRTPLNGIIGFAELLADSYFNEEQKKKFIQHIVNNGNSLLSIISDIMDISKLESGECKIHNSQINAQEFISNIKEQFTVLIEGKKLELKLSLPKNGEKTTIFADADRLKQIFNNLISNAMKFTKTGSIEIGYNLKSSNQNADGKPVELEFFVKDTGIGIAAEHHDKIFERFRQVETSNTRKFGGNGLGLSISKNLVDLMGGKIWFESEICKGSKFYFTVPIYSETIK